MNATVSDSDGQNIPVYMGSYGVGLSRLVGAVIEANHDKDGIVWPKEITPWYYNIINLKVGDEDCDNACLDLYNLIREKNIQFFTMTQMKEPDLNLQELIC